MVTALAAPPLDGDPVHMVLVQGFAWVEAVADEAVHGLADGTDRGAGEDDVVELGGVLMDGATKLNYNGRGLSLRHISEPTRLGMTSYAVLCLTRARAWH